MSEGLGTRAVITGHLLRRQALRWGQHVVMWALLLLVEFALRYHLGDPGTVERLFTEHPAPQLLTLELAALQVVRCYTHLIGPGVLAALFILYFSAPLVPLLLGTRPGIDTED